MTENGFKFFERMGLGESAKENEDLNFLDFKHTTVGLVQRKPNVITKNYFFNFVFIHDHTNQFGFAFGTCKFWGIIFIISEQNLLFVNI